MVVRLLVPFHVAGDSMALAARVWRQYGHYFQDDGVLQRQKDAVYRDHGKTKTPRALNWPRHSVVVLLLLLLLLRLPLLYPSLLTSRTHRWIFRRRRWITERIQSSRLSSYACTYIAWKHVLLVDHVILGNASRCACKFGTSFVQAL